MNQLNPDVMCRILELSFNPSTLATTCSIYYDLWTKRHSIRSNWLLIHSSNAQDAIEKASLIYNDALVTSNLLNRYSNKISLMWMAHLAVDLCRNPLVVDQKHDLLETKKTMNEAKKSILLSILPQIDLTIDITLYLKALIFADHHPYKIQQLWLIESSTSYISVYGACLFFCTLQGYKDVVEYLICLPESVQNIRFIHSSLLMAVQNEFVDIVQLLLQKHPTLYLESLEIPIEMARWTGNTTLLSMLLKLA